MRAVIFSQNIEVATKLAIQIKSLCSINRICFFTEIDNNIHFLENGDADIVFLDIVDELTNWQHLYKKMLIANEKIKIVLLCSDNRYAVKAYEIGAFDYIIKPVSDIRLIKLLKRLLNSE